MGTFLPSKLLYGTLWDFFAGYKLTEYLQFALNYAFWKRWPWAFVNKDIELSMFTRGVFV